MCRDGRCRTVHGPHFIPSVGRIYQIWHYVPHRSCVYRLHCRYISLNKYHISIFADFYGARHIIKSQSFCAFYGGHPQHFPAWHDFRILVFYLVEYGGHTHFIENAVFVVPVGLIAAKGHSSAKILELFGRRYDTIDHTYGGGAYDHPGAVVCDLFHFVFLCICKMYPYKAVVKETSFFQPVYAAHPVAHHHLLRLSVSLRQMHIHEGVVFTGKLLCLIQRFLADEIRPLRRKHHSYPAIACHMPFFEDLLCFSKGLFGIILVIIVKLSRSIYSVYGAPDTAPDISSDSDLIDKLTYRPFKRTFVTYGGSPVHNGLCNAQPSAGGTGLPGRIGQERPCSMHHPVAHILGYSSERG